MDIAWVRLRRRRLRLTSAATRCLRTACPWSTRASWSGRRSPHCHHARSRGSGTYCGRDWSRCMLRRLLPMQIPLLTLHIRGQEKKIKTRPACTGSEAHSYPKVAGRHMPVPHHTSIPSFHLSLLHNDKTVVDGPWPSFPGQTPPPPPSCRLGPLTWRRPPACCPDCS